MVAFDIRYFKREKDITCILAKKTRTVFSKGNESPPPACDVEHPTFSRFRVFGLNPLISSGDMLHAGLEVIKLEFILRLKIKRNDWLFADTCPQAANHCALF